jgi:hypothetical protein
MLKTTEEVQKFILWCKENKVKSFKLGDLHVELSELSFIPDNELIAPGAPAFTNSATLTDTEEESSKDEEEMLYWSTNR